MRDRLQGIFFGLSMVALTITYCARADDEGLMGSNRQRRAWGLDGREKNPALKSDAPKAKMGRPTNEEIAAREAEEKAEAAARAKEEAKIKKFQARCARDPKYFYQSVLAPQRFKDEYTGRTFSESLGKLHDFMFDFLTFQLSDVVRYSPLAKYMPAKEKNGHYKERWLYWKTLTSEPEIQDGPKGRLSAMFYGGEKIWRGLLIRIKGTAKTKCVLMPRGHLKSTICNQTYILWRVARQPAIRTLIKSLNSPNARSFMDEMKSHFTENDRFKYLYSHLGPPAKREGAWNADFIKVYCDERIGKEPTVWAQGVEAETASQHFDLILCDDVIAEKNTETPDQCRKGCERMQKLQGVRDPNTELVNLGTRWEDVDSHGMFVNKESTLAENCCFAVATVEDENHEPIWPEKWTKEAIKDKRDSMPIDRIFYGQYFNQFAGTASRNFKAEWIRTYHGKRKAVCKEHKLNIFIGADPASGTDVQTGKDFLGVVVIGQSERTKKCFILDGLNERLRAEEVPGALIKMVQRWKGVLDELSYGGTLVMGVEESAYTQYLKVLLDITLRQNNIDDFHIVPLKHNKISKRERIRVLAKPYAEGLILWPNAKPGTALHEFMEALRDQFVKFPGVTHDDLMDAHAYAYQLAELPDLKIKQPKKLPKKAGALPTRKESAMAAAEKRPNLGGYERDGQWSMGV